MRRRLLVRHFLSQFVENDAAPDIDRHQVLALVAAGVITLPLFTTVFMSVKYFLHPLQTPAWTQVTSLSDRMLFCAISMLASAIVATLEWDTLAPSARDAAILGVLPISHAEIVGAKVTALVTFAAAFIIALNVLPILIHPTVMVANLAVNPLQVVWLIAARGLSTIAAGAFGFAGVLTIRECLYLFAGRRWFGRVSDLVRSVLLFSFLTLLLLSPSRLLGQNEWMFERTGGPLLQRPVGWFVALDTVLAGRVLDHFPRIDLSVWEAEKDDRLVAQYRRGFPHLAARASLGAGTVVVLLLASATMYWWNARRLHVLPEGHEGMAILPIAFLARLLARVVARRPARRAGLLFLGQAVLGSPVHRVYFVASLAIGAALLLGMAPIGSDAASLPVRSTQLAAQTLLLTAVVAGFRAGIRTSADARATWVFGVADTGTIADFRNGVRAGLLTVTTAIVLVLAPMHAAAWGVPIASMHAVNGAVLGWLLVEIACGDVELPLVRTIPPNDALNTVGAVFLGAIVIGVFILARIERTILASRGRNVLLLAVMLALTAWVRHVHEQDHRAAAVLPTAL